MTSQDTADAAGPANAALVAALAGVLDARIIETHISWVLLAGDTALKIKKAVALPFVDYAAPEARRHYCHEEVRINRRLAPSLYLGVSAITGSPWAPVLDGPGAALDFAVRMRRLPEGSLFSERLERELLTPGEVDGLAQAMAAFHRDAPAAPAAGPGPDARASAPADAPAYGAAARRSATALASLHGAAPALEAQELAELRTWMARETRRLAALWEHRRTHGFVRECHGDLHLANVAVIDGRVCPFDAIEFDPALRFIDVLDDIAFAVMDFSARGRDDFAFRLLAGWLDATGDHAALPALRFALAARALVRTQAALMSGCAATARRYALAALGWARPGRPRLVITFGLPGSGKTWQSQRLLEREQAIRIRSDVERKRLSGLGMLDDSRAHGVDLYGAGATQRTYARLFELAAVALEAGFPVVLDAAFLKAAERSQAAGLARSAGVPFGILACEAPPEVLRARLRERRGDASEADEAVLELLMPLAEPLTAQEREFVIAPVSGG